MRAMELEHERRSAHERDVDARDERERLELAHARERDDNAKRQRADERHDEYLERQHEARPQIGQDHGHHLHECGIHTHHLVYSVQRGDLNMAAPQVPGYEAGLLAQAPVLVADAVGGVLLADLLDGAIGIHLLERRGDLVGQAARCPS